MADASYLRIYAVPTGRARAMNRVMGPHAFMAFHGKPKAGTGYLAGQVRLPQPVLATVRILYRHATTGELGDGDLVAQVITAADGTWRVDNLNTNLRYDVVCRKTGYNDEITANVQPLPM